MKVYAEHMTADGTLKRYGQLQDQDYRPLIEDLRTVNSESQGHSYLIAKVKCLNVPFAEADVAQDETTVYLCGCDDFWYNRSKGFENGDMQPTEMKECKHITNEFAAERAMRDDKQATLYPED